MNECQMTNISTYEKNIQPEWNTFNLTEKWIQLDFKTIQQEENNSTCIRQYHSVRYSIMHVELFLQV